MRRWYKIEGISWSRRVLAGDARDAVLTVTDRWRYVLRVTVVKTGEVVAEKLWTPLPSPVS